MDMWQFNKKTKQIISVYVTVQVHCAVKVHVLCSGSMKSNGMQSPVCISYFSTRLDKAPFAKPPSNTSSVLLKQQNKIKPVVETLNQKPFQESISSAFKFVFALDSSNYNLSHRGNKQLHSKILSLKVIELSEENLQ